MHLLLIHSGLGLVALGLGLIALGLGLGLGLGLDLVASASYTSGLVNIPGYVCVSQVLSGGNFIVRREWETCCPVQFS